MVAKTYQSWVACGEPYKQNGRMYIDVQKTSTSPARRVRWYSDKEYAKMYGETIPQEKKFNQRKVLGFDPYIWIFKGNTYDELEWFRESPCRYSEFFGWYLPAAIALPEDLPNELNPIQLMWNVVGNEDDTLKSEKEVSAAIENILFDKDPSEWVGNVGDKVELFVEVERAYTFDGYYGLTTIHTLRGEDGNVYVWSTSAKHWEVGDGYFITGTIKDHKQYKGVKQTVLTRCRVKEI